MEEREKQGLRKGKKFSDSWFVSLAIFPSLFCVYFRLPGWLVGLHVAVAGNSGCCRRRGLVAACSMVVREKFLKTGRMNETPFRGRH